MTFHVHFENRRFHERFSTIVTSNTVNVAFQVSFQDSNLITFSTGAPTTCSGDQQSGGEGMHIEIGRFHENFSNHLCI